MKMEDYLRICEQHIAEIQGKMDAIGDNLDPEYKRLRKQKIAYNARLKNRLVRSGRQSQLIQTDIVIQNVLDLARQLCPAGKREQMNAKLQSLLSQ